MIEFAKVNLDIISSNLNENNLKDLQKNIKLLQALQFNLPIPKEEKITPEKIEEFMEKKRVMFDNFKKATITVMDDKFSLSTTPTDLAELIKENKQDG
jgi:hypothetical protein